MYQYKKYNALIALCLFIGTTNAQNPFPSARTENDSMVSFNTYCKDLPLLQWKKERGKEMADNGIANTSTEMFSIKGTVRYDFLYRSLIDTPYYQQDFSQHTIQGNLNMTIKDIYPIRASFQGRKNNSPYFKGMFDVNVQFRGEAFLSNIKNNLRRQVDIKADQLLAKKMEQYEQLYLQQQKEISELRKWINNPSQQVRIIKNREYDVSRHAVADTAKWAAEQALLEKLGNVKGFDKESQEQLGEKRLDEWLGNKDTIYKNLEQKKKELALKEERLKEYKEKIRSGTAQLKDSTDRWKKEISDIRDTEQLKNYLSRNKSNLQMPSGWKTLAAINQVGVGRTWADISDLTVKNVSLTGIQAEINPSSLYMAAGVGRINARYRDFILRNNHAPSQSLFFTRLGIGRKNGNNLIVTYYNGKKSLLQFTPAVTDVPTQRVMGVSVESRIMINPNSWAALEVARSSYYDATPSPEDGLMKKVLNLKDRSNEAYSIKGGSYWPKTKTRLTGLFRKSGRHFQSFNLQPVNSEQESYQLKVQQTLWRRRLQLEASIRKNDFTNPFIAPGVSSKTVFKTASISVRIPKMPIVTVSYYPSSQLTLIDNNILIENQYNALSGIVSYGYRAGSVSMNTSAVFLQFFNEGKDTGFIYYNTKNFSVQHSIFIGLMQFESGFTYSWQPDMTITTLSQSASLPLRKWLTATGGLKYNRVKRLQTAWGGTAGMNITIDKIGIVQLLYDKSYLPGTVNNLVPVDMGRVGVIRNF